MTDLTPNPPSQINIRYPSLYQTSSASATQEEAPAWQPPPLEFLERTWTVTHSTLPMWRKAKNVRITYKIIPGNGTGTGTGPVLLDDVVESVPTARTFLPQPRMIKGVDTPDEKVPAAWNWMGRGWLRITSSHWEVLGWGERDGEGDGGKERWVVTWFAPSLFTPAGVDVYSDRRGGGSHALVEELLRRLEGLGCREVSEVCRGEMRKVVVDDA
ncbi:uncharacterized protein LY89DRAFT_708184 [Mollisia scopiformis]|uniref:Uncharacterized protein n=1 Tax=Mollisia scopiformis TaxID=149040 RepID=A0A194X5E9_MOLSC|nr:uncharacterized protein LY89DRAFT_708184 [Mollisia scopiformis]KUJ15299.1 hypothetical protein LY89DRAFT_708184 [Mollisia scopiformis]